MNKTFKIAQIDKNSKLRRQKYKCFMLQMNSII